MSPGSIQVNKVDIMSSIDSDNAFSPDSMMMKSQDTKTFKSNKTICET